MASCPVCGSTFAPRKPPPATARRYVTDGEIQAVVRSLEGLTAKSGRPLSYAPAHAVMVLLMAYCGLRVGEAIALRVDAVDLESRVVRVVASLEETPSGPAIGEPRDGIHRSIPVPDFLMPRLTRLVEGRGQEEFVFTGSRGGMINRTWWFNRVWKVARDAASIDEDVTPYSLRHFFAASTVANGASDKRLQELMGFVSIPNLKETYRDLFPRGRPRKYCSDRCTKKANRYSKTRACSRESCQKPMLAKDLCATHYNSTFHKGSQRKSDTPEKKRLRDRKRTQWRRAVVCDPDADLIDRDVVGKRDGWVCGICRCDVDSSRAWPDPKSPSLDHIVPLSRGGRHTYSNVRITHLTCNVKRGARIEV